MRCVAPSEKIPRKLPRKFLGNFREKSQTL